MAKPALRTDKHNYYLDIAETVLERGTCLRRNFGAIIVRNDQIISTGYTGAPRGRKNCLDLGVCQREAMNIPRGERYELCRSVHAEANAIISASRNDMIGSVGSAETESIAKAGASIVNNTSNNIDMLSKLGISVSGADYTLSIDKEKFLKSLKLVYDLKVTENSIVDAKEEIPEDDIIKGIELVCYPDYNTIPEFDNLTEGEKIYIKALV